ncbi:MULTISPECIES: hypothetical protein [unclassified Mesorhizobium]|uniref:hypothetical protein n=1 Tax=unclassified Mesorhizobium TaxID=325217 RepID=UPI00333DEEF6
MPAIAGYSTLTMFAAWPHRAGELEIDEGLPLITAEPRTASAAKWYFCPSHSRL